MATQRKKKDPMDAESPSSPERMAEEEVSEDGEEGTTMASRDDEKTARDAVDVDVLFGATAEGGYAATEATEVITPIGAAEAVAPGGTTEAVAPAAPIERAVSTAETEVLTPTAATLPGAEFIPAAVPAVPPFDRTVPPPELYRRPSVRWGALVWGVLCIAVGGVAINALLGNGGSGAVTAWIQDLDVRGLVLSSIVGACVLVLVIALVAGLTSAANRVERNRR